MASKSISKSVIWQLSGKFALQGIAFFTTPIFTRLLSPADYGYTAIYESWLAILTLVIGLCSYGSIGNARITYGEEKLPEYLSSIMTISICSFLLIFLFSFFANKTLSNMMEISQQMVVLIVIHSFFLYVINFEIARLDTLKKVEKSTLLSLFQAIIIIILSLIFVLNASENKAEAKIYGRAVTTIIIGLFILVLIYKRGKTIWNSEYCKFCLQLTLPLIVHLIGHMVFNQSDRIMLKKMNDESTLGIYSVSITLCSVLNIIYGALNIAWGPFYFDFKRDNKKEEILNHSKRYIKFYTLISIGFILLSYDVFKLMAPPEYYDGMKIIPLFVLSQFFGFIYLFPVNYEFFIRKTSYIPIATIGAAIINIVLNWFLIPKYGILGAAVGTLFAHLLLFLFHQIMAIFLGGSDYEYNNIILFIFPVVINSIICGLFYILPLPNFWIRWIIAIIIGMYVLRDFIKYRSIF